MEEGERSLLVVADSVGIPYTRKADYGRLRQLHSSWVRERHVPRTWRQHHQARVRAEYVACSAGCPLKRKRLQQSDSDPARVLASVVIASVGAVT